MHSCYKKVVLDIFYAMYTSLFVTFQNSECPLFPKLFETKDAL